ncbi:hypothetical protein NPQ18_13515 [Galbibacter orientalis]
MKRFEVYKNIRKQAVIFGLPISLFAVQMVCIVASLLVIIFSFSFGMVVGTLIFNSVLYIILSWFTKNPNCFQIKSVFPDRMSHKRNSKIDYEAN